jgi:aminoglycoside phosphotransferase (APT) family kinase protein
MSTMPSLPAAPTGRTAQRLEWKFLPPHVRELIERRCGSSVVLAQSQGGGFTPGFASVLTCADGSRHFVKAASVRAQRVFADSYREEARKLAALPESVPAARLLWLDDEDWVVLGLEYVEGRLPRRPWRQAELNRCLDAVEQMSLTLTPAPPGLALDTVAHDLGGFVDAWEHIVDTRPDLPHRDEAAALAADFAEVAAGDTLVHTDLRDDNLILAPDGRVWMCDWNWPVLGARWLDTLFLLLQPRGDGLDVDAVLASRALTREVDPEHIDRVLALLAGYFFRQGEEPVPPTSPYLRQHQQWCAEVVWDWLSERRAWR